MANIARFGIAGAALLLTSACVSLDAEDAVSSIETPMSWAALSNEMAAEVAPVTQDWLADIDDDTITSIVSEAVENNNDLGAAAARVKAARQSARATMAGLFPSLSGSLGASRSRSPGGTVQQNGQLVEFQGGYSNSTNLGLNLTWEADVWGRLTDQTRSAYLQAEAANLDYAAAQLSIAGGAAQAWYALAEARLQRQLSERDVETGEANLRIIERRYDRGISSSLDVRLARSSLASSRATLLSRRQAELEASRRLEVLIGRYPRAALTNLSTLPDLEPMVDGEGAVIGLGDPAGLLFRRPDVLAAEARLESAGLDLSVARKQFLPALQVTGSGSWDDTSVQDLFDIDQVVANMSARLVQPLFQGGRLKANAAARRHELEASLHDYAQTVLTAYQDVENALAAERFLSGRYDAQRLAFEEAAASEDLTTRQYLSGTTDIFNLISAQQRRISAEAAYISAARARLSNRIDLYLALGAPFDVPENAPLTQQAPRAERAALATPDQEGDRS